MGNAAPAAINTEEGDDFEDIIDSPHGAQHAGLMVGDADDDLANGESEFTIRGSAGSAEDAAFDQSVGVLQEVVLRDDFENMLTAFCSEHSDKFEDTEENKLIYT